MKPLFTIKLDGFYLIDSSLGSIRFKQPKHFTYEEVVAWRNKAWNLIEVEVVDYVW